MSAEHPKPHEHPYEPINTFTHGLALSPDEQEVWVTSLLDDAMYVYDVKSQKIVGRLLREAGRIGSLSRPMASTFASAMQPTTMFLSLM